MAIVKRGNVWWAYFTKRVYGEDGEQTLSKTGKLAFKKQWYRLSTNAADAQIKYGKILELRRMEKDGIATGKADFQTWKENYLDFVKKTKSPRTYNLTKRAFFVLSQYKRIKNLSEITPQFLGIFRDDYLVGELKYKPVLANRTIRVFTTAMHDAERRGLIYAQEWRNIGRKLKEPTRAKSNFLKAEVRRMLLWKPDSTNSFYKSRRWWTCFIAHTVFTGARRSETAGALKTDIDTDNWILHIQGHKQNIARGILLPHEVKDAEKRDIPVHPRLRPYYRWLLQQNLKSPYLFSHRDGSPTNPDFYTTHFRKFAEQAGVTNATPHRLRHTFGTMLGNSNVGSKTILTLMGHSDLKTAFAYMGNGEEAAAIKKIKI